MGEWEGRRRIAACGALALLLVACSHPKGPSPEATSPSSTGPTATTLVGSVVASVALSGLGRLRVAEPDPALPPYRRAAFGGSGWEYDPASGCNTRERVLIAESLVTATVGARCKVLGGSWVSLYDGVRTTDPADLQIDHFVPLAEAWRSGAASWTDERRKRFANDTSDPSTLVAVSGHSNESKGDDTPDEWLPPDRDAWCTYAVDWIEVKGRWQLSVTAAEGATLRQILRSC